MNLRFTGKKISALVTVLPSRETRFEDEMGNFGFSRAKSMKLKLVMGFDRHRLAGEGTCASDLCLHGLKRLFEAGELRPEEIDALLFVSQSPDHLIPATSNLIQGRAGLGRNTFCLDINQGCAGFVIGLVQAFLMLESGLWRKVVLMNGDTLSHRVGKRDRNIFPMVGDAGSVAVVENDPSGPPIHAVVYMDGSRSGVLQIPAGGARMPSTAATAVEEDVGDGNLRSKDHFFMDGPAVFNFVQTEVPPMIGELLAAAGATKEEVEYFLFHQPNRFMLEKLADALEVPRDRMPNNIVENFGNASSASIPTAIAFNLGAALRERKVRVCLGGFGVGLTWAALLMDLGPMRICELTNYGCDD
jgi:3-oxoacyl-[acyl-carrier-protein] synthase-3